MTLSKVVHSHITDEHPTPRAFFDMLDLEFAFQLDPCATEENAKCDLYFNMAENGLMQDWGSRRIFVNPPYSDALTWVEKSRVAARDGATVVMLLASRTGTDWFCDEVMRYAAEVRFVRGRLKFGDGKGGAPFDSVVVVFRPGHSGPPTFSTIGRNATENAIRAAMAFVSQERMI